MNDMNELNQLLTDQAMPGRGGDGMTLSLESSKRLHELGVVVESKMQWAYSYDGGFRVDIHEAIEPDFYDINLGVFPAPTFKELWADTDYKDKREPQHWIFEHDDPTEALAIHRIRLIELELEKETP